NRYDKTTDQFRHYQHDPDNPQSLSGNDVRSIFEDSAGRLWVGTSTGGLNLLNQKNQHQGLQREREHKKEQEGFIHYRHQSNDEHSLTDDFVRVITEDNSGQLWIGTQNGLNRFNPQSQNFSRYIHSPQLPQSISDNDILALYPAKDGTLWIATSGGGVNQFDLQSQTFTRYLHDPDTLNTLNNNNSLSHNVVNAIYQDTQGIFWFGTAGGLNQFEPQTKTFTHYREKQGLSHDFVAAVLSDKNGQLWLSLGDGSMALFDPKSAGIKNNIAAKSNCSANPGTYFKAEDGQFLVGNDEGYCAFYPEKIIQPSQPPKLVFTDFRLINQSVAVNNKALNTNKASPLTKVINHTQSLTLNHQQNVLSFEFAALHYADSQLNQYQYQLEGFDPNWIATKANNRRATYTNLAAGNYTFKVKASNHEALWMGHSRNITLIIKPAPWRTWWAYTLYILLVGAVIAALVRAQRHKLLAQRQKIVDQQQLNRKLTEVDKLKDEFLANTSHELRTPLNGIIGLAESLIDGVAGQLPNEANHNLAMVVSSGKRLSNLVNDILDFSKLKNRHLNLSQHPVDLYSLTEVVLTLSKPLVGSKPLELINFVSKNLPAVLADENRLQQILHNLVGNAIKFTDAGQVTVSAALSNTDHNQLTLSVTDTGIGIEKAQLDNIFTSFEQIEGDIQRTQSGTGLGLSVSKQLVELHGGTITVTSKVGKGSVFGFNLAVTEQKASTQSRQIVSRLHLLDEIDLAPAVTTITNTTINITNGDVQFRILLVDDEPVNRQVLLNHLSLQNYQLVEVSGGEQALKAIKEDGPFDLILLDVMMPKVSGYDVCAKVRESHPVNDLPVIFLTAKNQVADMMQSFASGGNDYLSKPVSKHELLTRVETHLKFLDIHRNLESKVSERTVELEQKNKEIIDTQQQLVQAEKMSSLGTLTAGVAHEINNPNNFVYASSQNLEVDLTRFQQFLFELAGDDAPEAILNQFREQFKPLHEHLNGIQNGAQRINIIVEDLSTFSQLDSAEHQTVTITDLLQSTINLVQTKFAHTAEFITDFAVKPGSGLESEAEADSALKLECYPAQLNQVFMNLIVNACDAIVLNQQTGQQTGQQSSDRPGKIVIGCQLINEVIEISVRDNGCGMTDETKNKLFEPFYTTKEVGKGTGLGLSIAFGVVQKHGGEMRVESELGVGTTFWLDLPCKGVG
ncbi:MAG: signal transduction histidine kinase, partial [Phenylobacterium sp.]